MDTHPASFDVLSDDRVRFVRIVWVDFINFVRYRIVPISHFRRLVTGSGGGNRKPNRLEYNGDREQEGGDVEYNPHGGIQLTKAAFGLAFLSMAEGFGPSGEYIYAPDLSTARWLPYAPGHASVFGWFEEKEAVINADSFEAALCPRALLRRIVEDAKQTDDVEFLMGVETEVIFLKSVDPPEGVNEYGWSESAAILAGSAEAQALEEIADALEKAGIELQMYHAEAAPGQFEIVTGPLPPLQACDALVTTREIIMNFAAKHGIRATLAPRVFGHSCGSAAHTHISLKSSSWPRKRISVPVSGPPSVSLAPIESAFLAGLLEHLPATLAFTLPTRASYARMADGAWSGGTWVAWGRDNREAPVRLAGRGAGPSGPEYHFEVKCVDGTASPYLAAASLLAAGMTGVRAHAELKTHGLHIAPAEMSEAERIKRGVSQRMPLTLDEARAALREDGMMRSVLGEELVKTYLSVNKALDEQLAAPTPEEAMVKLVKTY